MSERILLVEGEADRAFYEQMCKMLELNPSIKVAPPKILGGTHNTKEGVFNHLPVLLSQLADGQLAQLAIAVDADSEAHGGGYSRTVSRVEEIIEPFGFTPLSNNGSGTVFQHNDGLADFGVWTMPNNQDEGMLEDWIKHCVHPDEEGLFSHAATVVAALPQPRKFKPIHQSKAEVATWLAWQKAPGHGLYAAVEDQLLDTQCPSFLSLSNWLRRIFS
jgi:hypothetical protein